MPILKEVARKVGVSPSAVSLVVNNKSDKRIREDLKVKILEACEELDYHPHLIAKGFVERKTYNIGIALRSIDYITLLYFSTIIGGIAHQVGLHNYKMQFTVTDETPGDSAKNLSFKKNVKEKTLDGLIIIDQCVSDNEILWLKNENVPFVLVDRFIPGKKVNCILMDNKKGNFDMTEYLICLGHKRIAFISEVLAENKIQAMLDGHKSCLNKHGLQFAEEIFLPHYTERNHKMVYDGIEYLINLPNPPTAIITSSDEIAVIMLKALRGKGLRIPEDISVAGYNNDPNFIPIEPQLTTMQVPLRELGERSARMLFELINDQDVKEPEVVLEPELIIRQSCGGRQFTKAVGVTS